MHVRVIDGVNLAGILFSEAPETAEGGHECIIFYKSVHSETGPAGAAELDQMSAVRCGDYKVYYFIDGDMSTPLPDGLVSGVQSLDNPVIFNVAKDWSESRPLSNTTATYTRAKVAAAAARKSHLASLGWNVNQMAKGCSRKVSICSDPNSTSKYPKLANCTISPDNWLPPVCLKGGNRDSCTSQKEGDRSCKFFSC